MRQCLSIDNGCSDVQHAVQPEIGKMGTLCRKWGPFGDQELKKVPMGTQVPKMGTHLGAVKEEKAHNPFHTL